MDNAHTKEKQYSPQSSQMYNKYNNSYNKNKYSYDKNVWRNNNRRPHLNLNNGRKNYNSFDILSDNCSSTTNSSYHSHYCNNCCKNGHSFYQCKNPITSYGVIAFRYHINASTKQPERQYLMIRRRDTLSYLDFMRGKYSLFNRKYIKNLMTTMTEFEKKQISSQPFDVLWYELWKDNVPQEKLNDTTFSPMPNEEKNNDTKRELYSDAVKTRNNHKKDFPQDVLGEFNANSINAQEPKAAEPEAEPRSNGDKYTPKDKYNILQSGKLLNGTKNHFTIADIIDEIEKERLNNEKSIEIWNEPEWGFCKGRRNYRENDYDCAIREMEEETGYSRKHMKIIKNINTFEEIFIGSNYKCYKHKYYLMYMNYEDSLKTGNFEKSEVSCVRWASFNDCINLIRSYNLEKKCMITNIDNALNKYKIYSDCL